MVQHRVNEIFLRLNLLSVALDGVAETDGVVAARGARSVAHRELLRIPVDAHADGVGEAHSLLRIADG